jgi:hypothetical protein
LCILVETHNSNGFFLAAFTYPSNDAGLEFDGPSSGFNYDIPCILAAPVVGFCQSSCIPVTEQKQLLLSKLSTLKQTADPPLSGT